MLLCLRRNGSGANFPRTCGRPPYLRYVNRHFLGHSAHPPWFRRTSKMAARWQSWFRRRLSESLRDWACWLVSIPSINTARSPRSFFSSLFSWASLDRLAATPWRFLSSLIRFVARRSRWSFKPFSRSPSNSRDPFSDFSLSTSCSLTFNICLNVDTKISSKMPHPDDVSSRGTNRQTPRELSTPPHHPAPHQSLRNPMTSVVRGTNKQTPRELSTSCHARTCVPNISPLTRGNKDWLSASCHTSYSSLPPGRCLTPRPHLIK